MFLSMITSSPKLRVFYDKAFNSSEEQVLQGSLNKHVLVRGSLGFSSWGDAFGKKS